MTTIEAPMAGRREWIGLAVLALACLLYAMDLTVLNLTVPALSADLHPTPTELLWIADVYGFVTAGLLVTMGTVGDRIGRRRLLMIGENPVASALVGIRTQRLILVAFVLGGALYGVAGVVLLA